jgi:hypothetical protein
MKELRPRAPSSPLAYRASLANLVAGAMLVPLAAVGCGGSTLEPLFAEDAGAATDAGHSPTHPPPHPDDSGACTPEVSAATCGANVTFPCGIVSGSNGTALDAETCDLVCGVAGATCYVYETVSAGDTVFVPCGPCGGS